MNRIKRITPGDTIGIVSPSHIAVEANYPQTNWGYTFNFAMHLNGEYCAYDPAAKIYYIP